MATIIENHNFFLDTDLSEFAGQWVAIVNKQVVASGKNLKDVVEEAKKKHPKEEPLIAKAPTGKPLIL